MSIPNKKVDQGDDNLVRLVFTPATDRREYTGDGTPAAFSTYLGGREYTITDNPGGTPVPDYVADDVIAAAKERNMVVKYLNDVPAPDDATTENASLDDNGDPIVSAASLQTPDSAVTELQGIQE